MEENQKQQQQEQQKEQQKEQQPQAAPQQPKENGTVVQEEASSTTPPAAEEVVTKRSLRLQTWKKLQEARCAINSRAIFNRIPNFVGNDKAAQLLAETDEFKNAKTIKVNIDRAQDQVKFNAINEGKDVFLPPSKGTQFLYTKVDCPPDADEKMKQKILQIANWKEHRKDIALDDKVKLDMIIIGSVLVSRDGYRIGRGNGFVDLDVGLLLHLGVITPETTIVTTVHDLQVTDQLPTNLFQKYDTPVDIIVTPTEVIRVTKRLPRPKGLFWELLSERRLKIVPVLQLIKENEEKEGKVVVLKAEDTDVETNGQQRQRLRRRPLYNKYRNPRTRSEPKADNDREDREKPQRRRRRFNNNRRRRQTKSEGEHSSGENKENEQSQTRTVRKKRNNRDFCIKVSKISRGVRIKDLKAELRKRECNPVHIAWKGSFGKCYLHFATRKGNEKDAEIEKVLKSLNDLTLTIENGENSKTINLQVELLKIKDDNTVEPVNTSTV